MKIRVQDGGLPGVRILHHDAFDDDRGFFMEVYREDEYAKAGLPTRFVQVNQSHSRRGVIRGLHFQWDPPMGKLMRVIQGEAFLVAVDIRRGSPTCGKWVGRHTTADEKIQIWAPAGFARGFAVISESADIQYMCTGIYNAAAESGIRWDDPAIGIEWPVTDPALSPKDAAAQTFAEWLVRPESEKLQYQTSG